MKRYVYFYIFSNGKIGSYQNGESGFITSQVQGVYRNVYIIKLPNWAIIDSKLNLKAFLENDLVDFFLTNFFS